MSAADISHIIQQPYQPLTLECVAQASDRYQVPEALLLAIMKKEGGHVGQAVRNTNGSLDLGPAQINTSWLPTLAQYGITKSLLKNNGCLNLQVGAWILSTHHYNTEDWTRAIIYYHTGPGVSAKVLRTRGVAYARDVIKYWTQYHNASKDFGYSPVRFYQSKGYK